MGAVDRALEVEGPEEWVWFQHDLRHAQDTSAAFPSLPIQAPLALCNVLNSTIHAPSYEDEEVLRAVASPLQYSG